MSTLFNRPDQKPRRQYLRTHMTRAETVLWLSLRGRGVEGAKFRRQQGVGTYILDFYCPELHLAIEVDGVSHEDSSVKAQDRQRQASLEHAGIRFLRFTDDEVLGNPDRVVERISREVRRLRRL